MPEIPDADRSDATPSRTASGKRGPSPHHRVVIVGAGFGGMNAARALDGTDAEVVLIDRTNHNLFQPLLYQVATAALAGNDIALPIRSIFRRQRNVTVVMDTLSSIDRASRELHFESGASLGYDTLVLATGSVYSWFGHDDWKQNSTGLKTLAEADFLRNRLLDAFEKAELATDPAEIRALLTFVLIGAGPTGVELAGALAELSRLTLVRDFRHIHPADARIVLCDAGPRVLASFPPRLSAYAARRLQALGVELLLNTPVKDVRADDVTAGDKVIAARTVFWAAGTQATPVASWLGVKPARQGLTEVEPDCTLPGHPEIFVIGDAASCKGRDGKQLPGLASVAKQQGIYVGGLIAARLGHGPLAERKRPVWKRPVWKRRLGGRPAPRSTGDAAPLPFQYRDYGQLAMIGRSSAVADFGWICLTGYPAWVLWSAVHLLLLVSVRNRLVVYVNWAWAWLTYARGARVITGEPDLEFDTTAGAGHATTSGATP